MILRCAIIDDEPLAAELLKSYAEKTPFLSIIGVFNSALTAIKVLREEPADLVFLDIQMPEISGVEFSKVLPSTTKVIFTTAFSQYAIEGYKVGAVDYLLKPFSYDDFLTASLKVIQESEITTNVNDRFIFVRSEYKLIRIDFDDILYIEGVKDYVKIVLQDGRKILSLLNVKRIEDILPCPEFIRVHRSFIAHMTKVDSVERMRLIFNKDYIPISDLAKVEVMKYLNDHTVQ